MNFDLLLTLVVLFGVGLGLLQDRIGAEIVLLAGLVVLAAFGVVDVRTALSGFASTSVITIGALFVLGAGLRSTGAIEVMGRWLLGRPEPGRAGLLKMTAPVAGLSAFLNNTPLVALFMPIYIQYAKRLRVSPSRVLLPLSYAAMLGGTITLVGTSTNLVVDRILREQTDTEPGLGMFELMWVGLPLTVLGLAYMAWFSWRLLPHREDLLERLESHPREYTVEMVVRYDCPLVGKAVRASGLRDLPGLYLFRIERTPRTITPVSPDEIILAGDHLHFSGIVSTVVDLQRIRGLEPVEHLSAVERLLHTSGSANSLDSMEGVPPGVIKPPPRLERRLCEAVIAAASPLLNRSIKDINFRSHYNASIIAVHRSGKKLQQKIGQIILEPGDTLLIDADLDFPKRWRNSADFVLVAGVEDSGPVAHERTWLAMLIFLLVIGAMSLMDDPVLAALAGALLMVLTGCVPSGEVARSIELPVLVLVAAAFGIGEAMESSGAANWLGGGVIGVVNGTKQIGAPDIVTRGALLLTIYILTNVLTQFLNNNAAAALMGSLTLAAAELAGANPRPLLIAVAIAASAAFATPVGFATNLMVRNAGGYRFVDYVRFGLPLVILSGLVSVTIIPLVWGF